MLGEGHFARLHTMGYYVVASGGGFELPDTLIKSY